MTDIDPQTLGMIAASGGVGFASIHKYGESFSRVMNLGKDLAKIEEQLKKLDENLEKAAAHRAATDAHLARLDERSSRYQKVEEKNEKLQEEMVGLGRILKEIRDLQSP